MIQDIYKNTRPLHLGVGLLAILALLSGCSSDDSLPEDTTGAFLQPVFHMSGVETRSIISGTSTTEGEGRINAVKLFVTKAEDGYTPYGGVGTAGNAGLSTFTYQSVGSGGNDWVGDPTVNLSSVKARIYAYSPANAILTKSTTTTTHTIATTLPVHQNFYGGKRDDTTDDRTLSANLSQITWKRGHTHKIQITLSNRAITVNADILPWTESGSAGTGDVKPGGY